MRLLSSPAPYPAAMPVSASSDLSDLPARIAYAAPAALVTIAVVAAGGEPFAIAIAALGVLAALELYRMLGVSKAVAVVGCAGVVALIGAALYGGRAALAPALVGTLALLFLAAASGGGALRVGAVGAGLLGLVWIGVCLAHGVLLRELDHGGALVIAVLLGTFLGDTAAHLCGSVFGRRALAPSISPSKTVEGLLGGVIVGTTTVVAFAAAWHEWLQATDALALGLAVSLAAPAGDLAESFVKRSVGVKDVGELLGPHGGVLDLLDAALFTAVAGYYVALALL